MQNEKDKEIEQAESNLKEAEVELKAAETAEEAAEKRVEEAVEQLEEAREHHFEILIDRKTYIVELRYMTGSQLRALPSPPIGPDRDLWQEVRGGTDRKIGDNEVVEMRNGLRFFSAPAQINPGVEKPTPKA